MLIYLYVLSILKRWVSINELTINPFKIKIKKLTVQSLLISHLFRTGQVLYKSVFIWKFFKLKKYEFMFCTLLIHESLTMSSKICCPTFYVCKKKLSFLISLFVAFYFLKKFQLSAHLPNYEIFMFLSLL